MSAVFLHWKIPLMFCGAELFSPWILAVSMAQYPVGLNMHVTFPRVTMAEEEESLLSPKSLGTVNLLYPLHPSRPSPSLLSIWRGFKLAQVSSY